MGKPAQVQRQIEEAEALAAELGMTGAEPAPQDPPAEDPPADPPAEDPAPDTVVAAAEVVEITPEDPPADPTPEEPKAVDWEQKFKTLQGKYDAEIARSGEQLDTLQTQLSSQTAILAALQQSQEAAPAPAEEPAPEPDVVVTATEVEDYGEELLDVVGRKALLALQPTINNLMQRLDKLEQGVGKVEATALKSEQNAVYDALDKWASTNSVNWVDINKDASFKAWLGEVDPYVGQPRGVLLKDAFDANHAERVVAFFAGYLKEQTTVSPASTEPEATEVTPAAPEPTAQVDMETLVGPGGAPESAPASAHGDSAGKWFTAAEISQFYADVTAGRYKGREEEKNRIEAEMHAAATQGRVR